MALGPLFKRARKTLRHLSPEDKCALDGLCDRIQEAEANFHTSAADAFEKCRTTCEGICCRNVELNAVLDSYNTVFVDFWAKWCRPCLGFLPILEKAADRHPDIFFCRVNAGEAKELRDAFEIESIPTLVVIRDRVMIASQPGLLPSDVLEDLIQKVRVLDMDQVRRELDTQGQNQ